MSLDNALRQLLDALYNASEGNILELVPFQRLCEQLGLDQQTGLDRCEDLKRRGFMRPLGPLLGDWLITVAGIDEVENTRGNTGPRKERMTFLRCIDEKEKACPPISVSRDIISAALGWDPSRVGGIMAYCSQKGLIETERVAGRDVSGGGVLRLTEYGRHLLESDQYK